MKYIVNQPEKIRRDVCAASFRAALSRNNSEIADLFRSHCRYIDFCSLEKLNDYQEEITAVYNRSYHFIYYYRRFGYSYKREEYPKFLAFADFRRPDFAKIVHVPDEYVSVSPNVFHRIHFLEQVTFDNFLIDKFPRGLFYGCKHLRIVEVPNSVSVIERYAFGRCAELEDVTFGQNSKLTKVGKCAFAFCSSLKKIAFPPKLSDIGERIFNECVSLEEVVVPAAAQKDSTAENFGCSAQVKITFY